MNCKHDWQVGRRRKGKVRYRCVKCAVWDNQWYSCGSTSSEV